MSRHGFHSFVSEVPPYSYDTPLSDREEWDEIVRMGDRLRAFPSGRAATPSGLSQSSLASCQHGIPNAGER